MALDTGITHRDVGNADIAGANICPCRYDDSGTVVYNDESSGLGTQLAKLQLREPGSWSFQDCIPKPELGNEQAWERASHHRGHGLLLRDRDRFVSNPQ